MLPQAFAKDAKLLQLLKALITQQSQLAATPATQLTADHVKQLQQVVQEAEVKSPEAFKLDADQVRSPTRQPQCFVLAFTQLVGVIAAIYIQLHAVDGTSGMPTDQDKDTL